MHKVSASLFNPFETTPFRGRLDLYFSMCIYELVVNMGKNYKLQRAFSKQDFDIAASQLLHYANLVSRRGYVCNTLGNIAMRDPNKGVIYTKHKGVSLEEMTAENIVVKDINGKLLYGSRDTSVGNKLNCEIFKHRPDINAVIHLHPDDVIALFSVANWKEFPYLSIDAPPVLGKDPYILDPE